MNPTSLLSFLDCLCFPSPCLFDCVWLWEMGGAGQSLVEPLDLSWQRTHRRPSVANLTSADVALLISSWTAREALCPPRLINIPGICLAVTQTQRARIHVFLAEVLAPHERW
ncbi:hypothetical protein FQA47_011204 [Oryzias melastigma]|uniref:Secreted protein n=1 Tax=Oryzias melastigma TaxID=30732 RepID=A0A834FGG3_ORYME|nr:hypothetical protein FQA47_011204 [Oryzias melastigma]